MQANLSALKNSNETNNLGICLKKPFNISYATVGARIRSYSNWIKTSPKPVVLADAGFYYTGTEDVVQCFYCGLKLRSWDVFDDPWVEHARHGKHCPHVTNVKGNEFSKSLEKRLVMDHIEEDRALSKQETKRSLYSDDLIYTTAAKALLSMGCYRDQDIKDSIKLFVEKSNTLDFSASDILKILQNRSV